MCGACKAGTSKENEVGVERCEARTSDALLGDRQQPETREMEMRCSLRVGVSFTNGRGSAIFVEVRVSCGG